MSMTFMFVKQNGCFGTEIKKYHLWLAGRRQIQNGGLGHRQAVLLLRTVGHGWALKRPQNTHTRIQEKATAEGVKI